MIISGELFTLGDLYVSDFIAEGETPRGGREPLQLVMDELIGAPRLSKPCNPDLMYGKYWYRSGINSTMRNELKEIAEELPKLIAIENEDLWLDIACNDGTLLKHVPNNMIKVGIDPADDSFTRESRHIADDIIQDYFSKAVYLSSKYGTKKAKIITCIAMFYDVENPISFLKDVEEIMDDEGLLVLQLSYTPLMLRQLAFDNICHEHLYYYSLTSIDNLFCNVGMKVVDAKLNDINGGSIRVYIRKNKAKDSNFKTAPYRDVAQYRIDSLLSMERKEKITSYKPYFEFYEKILNLKEQTVKFIKEMKSHGKTIWCYGASTKGNTLLQWYGLDHNLIDGIAERSPYKFGLRTVGTNIPIYSEEDMRKAKPDYMLILPWHFIDEFVKREKDYLDSGGKFIVPCPKFEIIGGKNHAE